MMKEFRSPVHDIEKQNLKSVIYDWLVLDEKYTIDQKLKAFQQSLDSTLLREDMLHHMKGTIDLYLSFFQEDGVNFFDSKQYAGKQNEAVEHVLNSCGFVYKLCPDGWLHLDSNPVQKTLFSYIQRRVEKIQKEQNIFLNKKDKSEQWKEIEGLTGFIREQPIYPLISQKVVQNKLHSLFCEGYKKSMMAMCQQADTALRLEGNPRLKLKHSFKG